MTFVNYNRLNAIAKHWGGCARILCLGVVVAVFGWTPSSAGQIVVSNYSGLSAAIARGGLINQFATNFVQISLQTPSETFVVSNNVIIDATTNDVVLDGAELGRLFRVESNATLTLANLQLIGGISPLGGAIYNQGTLIISNCFFYSNSATNTTGVNGVDGVTNGTDNGTSATSGSSASGGAIYSLGTLIVSYSTFSNNVVSAGNGGNGGSGAPSDFLFGGDGGDGGSGGSASGGAISANGTNVFLATQFIFNECVAGSGGDGGTGGANTIPGDSGAGGTGGSATGGALWVSGQLYMTNCLFDTNSAIAGSTAPAKVLSDGTSKNASSGGSAVGGGMDISAATTAAYIENAIFFNNFCQGGAGGNTLDNPPEATAGNGGSAVGGGFCTAAAFTQLKCCTLATNELIGGTNGVSSAGGPNGSFGARTGFDLARSAGALRVLGTILSGGTNAAPNYTPNVAGGLTDAGYNISSDGSAGFTSPTSRSLLDPELDSALSSNHGGSNLGPASITVPTLTLAILTAPAVVTNSPALGALIGIAGVTFPAFDQTFFSRGDIADIGAFEVTPPVSNSIPPEITSNPVSETLISGETATFTVEALGTNLVYQWIKDDTNLIASIGTNYLTLTKVTTANAGSYTVLVGNSAGVVTSSVAVLTVLAPASRPTVAITSPAAGARTANPVLSGTATGTTPIVNYWITNVNNGVNSVLSGQAALAGGARSVSNWTISADLLPGTNILAVQGSVANIDIPSTVATRVFFYEVPSPFTVTTSGDGGGTVAGAAPAHGEAAPTNQALLNIGEGYLLTATPNKTSLFAGWTVSDGASTNTSDTPALRFIMESNLSVQAGFVANFFPEFAGAYNGLFWNTNAVTEETAGMISGLTIGGQGAYSAKVKLGGALYHDFGRLQHA